MGSPWKVGKFILGTCELSENRSVDLPVELEVVVGAL